MAISAVDSVFVIVFPPCPTLTLQTRDRVSSAALLRVPMVHVPAENVDDPEGVALTNVVPVGHESVIVNELACAVPLLVTPSEYVMLSPSLAVEEDTVFVVEISASLDIVVLAVAPSFALLGSI